MPRQSFEPTHVLEDTAPSTDNLWQEFIRVEDLEREARDFHLEPDEKHWKHLADSIGALALADLIAEIKVHKTKKSVRIRGWVRARITQTCVVTLEPIIQQLEEDVDRTFVTNPEDAERVLQRQNANREVLLDPEELDPPDILEDGYLDLAALVMEHVALGLDLYPRKEGANLADAARAQGIMTDDDVSGDGPGADSPFAALAKLKH